jgi:hypothetical protein
MLGDGDHVFVADFGIARAVEGGGPALTSTGVVGSPAYMAPEQWQGQQIDGRSDQYALGILAYELLTGKRPYRDATMHELLRLHLTEELPDISQDLPAAAPAMGTALRRATAKDPKDRFESTGAFVAALETSTGAPIVPTRAVDARPVAAPARRSRTPLLIGTLVVIGGGGAFAYSQMHSQGAASLPAAPVAPESIVVHDTVRERTRVVDTQRIQLPGKVDTVRVPVAAATSTTSAGLAPGGTSGGTSGGTQPNSPATPPASGGAVSGGSATVRGRGAPPASATGATAPAAGSGFILVNHPMIMAGQVRVDSTTTIVAGPSVIIAVAPGVHTVSFKAPGTPTVPLQWLPMVKSGDTVRVSFVPATGGGARGDSLRTRIADQQRRNALQRGRGGRRGGGG